MRKAGKFLNKITFRFKPFVWVVILIAAVVIQSDAFSPVDVQASVNTSPKANNNLTITKISPTIGPVAGNISVTISGANFSQVVEVTFGGVKATRFKIESPNSISVTIPPGQPGAVKVLVRTKDKTASLNNAFTYIAKTPPTITNQPSAPPTVATSPEPTNPTKTVTATVSNTSPAVTEPATENITPSPQPASPTPTVSQAANTTSPANTPAVTTDPESSPTVTISSSPTDSPPVTEVPTTVAPDPDATLTPTPVSTVADTPAVATTSVADPSPTSTPEVSPEPAPVTTPGVTPTDPVAISTPTSTTGITTPEETPATINPSPESTTAVSISPSPESTTAVSSSPATTPAVTTVGDPSPSITTSITGTPGNPSPTVVTETVGVDPTSTPVDTPTPSETPVVSPSPSLTPTPAVEGPPTITEVSPNSGPASGGTTVIIKGTNFTDQTQVTIGGLNPASAIVNSPTQLTVVTPPQPAGEKLIEVKTSFGKTQLANAFTYSAQSVWISQETTGFNYTGKLTGNVLVLKSTFNLGITDLSGSGAGWHLLARGSVLTNGVGVIPVANHTIQNVRVVTKSGTPPLNKVAYPLIFPISDETIFSAAPGTGNGESIITFDTELVVPPEIPAGNYSFTLNLSVEPGP